MSEQTSTPDSAAVEMTDHGWSGDDEGHNCYTCQERNDALHLCWPQSHLCSLCEKAPLAWPDSMCEPCRTHVERITDEVTDPVERLLSVHGRMEPLCSDDYTMCRCGLGFSGGPGYHRRHLAELIYEALGVAGPQPWVFGDESASRGRFDADGRIISDERPDRAEGT